MNLQQRFSASLVFAGVPGFFYWYYWVQKKPGRIAGPSLGVDPLQVLRYSFSTALPVADRPKI